MGEKHLEVGGGGTSQGALSVWGLLACTTHSHFKRFFFNFSFFPFIYIFLTPRTFCLAVEPINGVVVVSGEQ